jgi:ATP-binding cassette, subfamily B, bacterial
MPSTSSTLSTKRREKQVTRAIHHLFWDAMLQSKGYAAVTVLMHIPAFLMQNVFIPLGVAYALQAVITRHFEQLHGYVILVFALSIGYVLTMGIGSAAFGRNGVIGAAYVQRQVFSNYLHKDYDFYSNTFFGSLGAQAARVRDAFVDYNFVMLYEIPKQISVVLVAIGVIAYKSPLLACITLACMLVALGYTIASSRFRLKYRRIVGEASSNLAATVGDALSHAPTVKSFANEAYEEEHLEKPLRHWYISQIKSWDLFIPANGGRSFLVALTTCILLLVAGRLYQEHAISIAMVALVQLYAIKLLNATEEIATIIKQYEATLGASYQPVQTMLVPSTITDKEPTKRLPTARTMDIRFEHVRFSYPDGAKGALAVNDFDLTIKHGEKVGLIGYSGSGKTTITKLLLRFMDTMDGAIKLGDSNIRELSQKELRKTIAYVPQEPLLFHRSIAENILYAKPNATAKAMRHAANLAYVDEFVEAWPKAYDTMVGERGVKLSGGQRQRVAIARALLKDAPILVMDEATSALDSRSEQLIQKALWELMKDRTALVIAHRLSTIQRMDKIVVMDKGSVVQCGTHAELLKQKKGIYAKLWAHQSGGYLADPEALAEK